ncbi:MAG TPA: hypothetical protein PK583_03640, partial [Gammaproteobacteria bacterium]|nr:hypothetical protein [Gammaproteobacteria bacterium]
MMPEEADKTLKKEPEAVSPINPLGPLDLSEIEEPKTDFLEPSEALLFYQYETCDRIMKSIEMEEQKLKDSERLLKIGYSREFIKKLSVSAFQLKALAACDYKIEQAKVSSWIAFFEKFGKRFGAIIDKLVKTGLHPTEIASLTFLQLWGLEKECLGLGLVEVRHLRFCQSVILAMEAGHDFDTVINLEPWENQVLAVGLPFEKLRNLSENFTLRHLGVLKLIGAHYYDDIANLDYVELVKRWFKVACLSLPEAQKSLESSLEIKEDVFPSAVSINANSRETLSLSSAQRRIDLESWQHCLLVAGVSLEKVEACRHNSLFTRAHVQAVQAGANFD